MCTWGERGREGWMDGREVSRKVCVDERRDGGVGKHYFLYLVEVCFHDSLVVLPLVKLLMHI